MRIADPSPLGETSFRAIVRAICDADPANVCGGGCVESVLTFLTQRRCARFFAMGMEQLRRYGVHDQGQGINLFRCPDIFGVRRRSSV